MENFNLKKFLVENRLTRNSKVLAKGNISINGKDVEYGTIEVEGDYLSDVYIIAADYEDGTALTDKEVQQLEHKYPDLAPEVAYNEMSTGADYQNSTDLGEVSQPESKLAKVIQAAWAEKDINKAKQLVLDLIGTSKIKSKDQITYTIQGISNKGRLDQYLANSLLKFEKLGLAEDSVQEEADTVGDGYVEAMGDQFDDACEQLIQAWEAWKKGPETVEEAIEGARADVLAYIKRKLI